MPALKGTAVSAGIALGKALVVGRWEVAVPRYQLAPGAARAELAAVPTDA